MNTELVETKELQSGDKFSFRTKKRAIYWLFGVDCGEYFTYKAINSDYPIFTSKHGITGKVLKQLIKK